MRIFFALNLIFLLGCSVSFEQQLPLIKQGMTKQQVDDTLDDSGKWLGTIGTEVGVRNAWGYPKESFGMFSQNASKRYYLLFDNDKFTKYSDGFLPYSSASGAATPAGQASPGGFSGGGMVAGGAPADVSPGGM